MNILYFLKIPLTFPQTSMMKRFYENSERLNSLLLTIFAKSSIDEYIQLLFLFVTFDILLTVACNIYDDSFYLNC